MSSLLCKTAGMLASVEAARPLVGQILCGIFLAASASFLLRNQLRRLWEYLVSDFEVWLSESHMRNVLMPVYTAESPGPAATEEKSPAAYSEDQEFAKFRAALFPEAQPAPAASTNSDTAREEAPEPEPAEEVDPLEEFFSWAPERLARLRDLHQKFSRSDVPHDLLRGLLSEISALREKASPPELAPARQMATGLEGLVKQMSDRFHEVTPSTLRTVASGIDLLSNLCLPGLKADIATAPPIRMLAVDDDPISRVAVTFALKKAFDQPDLASNGEEALELATREAYDVIFLDVQMPGMDGFELCSKIRKTEVNGITPVVFVTVLQDFEARATSIVSGGNDLIGKPFLPFEITVKALTYTLRRRLKACGLLTETAVVQPGNEASEPAPAATPITAPTNPSPQPSAVEKGSTFDAVVNKSSSDPGGAPAPDANTRLSDTSMRMGQKAALPLDAPAPASLGQVEEPSPELIRAAALTGFGQLREHFELYRESQDPAAQAKLMESLHACALSLARSVNYPMLRPAHQVSSVLEALLKKLHDKPASATPSTMETVETAIELLSELCVSEVDPELADQPTINILVVDDDLLTRRAITGALQMVFPKPDHLGDGESAVAKAMEKAYDVIFMDVQMPGIDGFAACAGIRGTDLNRDTPVVFVTSATDFQSRQRSTESGGNDYVTKPFLFHELNVKALTFALRGRLQKSAENAAAA